LYFYNPPIPAIKQGSGFPTLAFSSLPRQSVPHRRLPFPRTRPAAAAGASASTSPPAPGQSDPPWPVGPCAPHGCHATALPPRVVRLRIHPSSFGMASLDQITGMPLGVSFYLNVRIFFGRGASLYYRALSRDTLAVLFYFVIYIVIIVFIVIVITYIFFKIIFYCCFFCFFLGVHSPAPLSVSSSARTSTLSLGSRPPACPRGERGPSEATPLWCLPHRCWRLKPVDFICGCFFLPQIHPLGFWSFICFE